ncbi:MAG: LacI family transcriptional regulator [Actinobacteria bacterium 13_1_20CM_3_71_11]|nr:MAG: LacI family transcriptional regulator [Actinobacteria bacterium 13_1_20CM_3_71_11]
MRDVAAAAGVSLMTVSRVVNGEGGVAAETAARVERAIAELGYQRNDIARHLRQKNRVSRTIGLVVDDLANPFYSIMARAVEDEAYRRGYLVLLGSTNDDPGRERDLVTAFSARQVDGLILVPTSGNQHALARLRTPLVCADRMARGLDVDTVTVDNRGGARQAVTHLLDQGHRRVAYLGDQRDIWTLRERYAGYRDAFSAAGLDVSADLVRHGLRSRTSAAAATVITMGAIDGLGAATREVALVGFDDFPLADKLSPAVTVVSQDPGTVGATAAQLLFSRIDGHPAPPRSVVLMTRFIPRGSGELRWPRRVTSGRT